MKRNLTSLAVAGLLMSNALHAEVNVSGFATIAVGATTTGEKGLYDYNADGWDHKQGSLLGLQVSTDITDKLGGTVQVVAKGSDDFDPEIEWAYLSYQATDELRVLVGRQGAPFYMYSDYINVSYAYSWITPPKGVYNLAFSSFDGLGLIYNTSYGDYDTTFHFIYGDNNRDAKYSGIYLGSEISDLTGLTATVTKDWLTLRAGYFTADVTLKSNTLNGLANTWRSVGSLVPDAVVPGIGVISNQIADHIALDDDKSTFLELGFQMDFDTISVVGEYTNLETEDSTISADKSYYVMANKRFDGMSIQLTYGADELEKDDFTQAIQLPTFVPDLNQLTAATRAGLFAPDKTSYITLGARFEVSDSSAVKVEYTDFNSKYDNSSDTGLVRAALVLVF